MTCFLDSPKIEENWQNWLGDGHYVFGHKMRTNNNWRAVEPILERRKTGESYEKDWVIGIHKIWSPDPLVWTGCIEKMMKCAQSGAWVPVSKYLINLNHLSTLPHLSSFQNGISEHVIFISSHFLNENVRTVGGSL